MPLVHLQLYHHFGIYFSRLNELNVCCEHCSTTADNGTAAEFGKEKRWTVGTYRLHFETGLYFHQHGMKTLFPHIDVCSVSAVDCFKFSFSFRKSEQMYSLILHCFDVGVSGASGLQKYCHNNSKNLLLGTGPT